MQRINTQRLVFEASPEHSEIPRGKKPWGTGRGFGVWETSPGLGEGESEIKRRQLHLALGKKK